MGQFAADGVRFVLQAQLLHDFVRPVACGRQGKAAVHLSGVAERGLQRSAQRFLYGQAFEQLGDLKRAAYAFVNNGIARQSDHVFTVQQNLSAVGLQAAGNQVEERGFASTVGADDGAQRALRKFHGHVGDSADAAEGFVKFVYGQHQWPPLLAAGSHLRQPLNTSVIPR